MIIEITQPDTPLLFSSANYIFLFGNPLLLKTDQNTKFKLI